MRTTLVIWMALIAVVACSMEFRDVYGIVHNTDGKNVVVVIGNTNCPPMDRMLMDHLFPLKRDYPDIEGIVLFPCESPSPASVRAWVDRVPNANLFCAVDYSITNLFLTNWMAMGAPQYGGWIYNKSGTCITNWPYWKDRRSVEVPLTRELNSLRIVRGSNGPVVSFRQTKIPWRVITNAGSMTTYQLVYP